MRNNIGHTISGTGLFLCAMLLFLTVALGSGEVTAEAAEPEVPAEAYEYIAQQIHEHNPSIDMTRFNILLDSHGDCPEADYQARVIYGAVSDEYPDTFEASTCTIDLREDGDNVYFGALNLDYVDGYDMEGFYAERDKALAVLEPGMSDLDKAIVLHDYLIAHTSYDFENFSSGVYNIRDNYNAYGVLYNKKGVCGGQAAAYKYLCNQAGVECYLVNDQSTEHVWNMVVIDGEPYNVEITSDDPNWDLLGRVWHSSLLVTDEQIADELHTSAGKVTYFGRELDLHATSKRFEKAFWKKCISQITYHDGSFYYSMYIDKSPVRSEIQVISAADVAENPARKGTKLAKESKYWHRENDPDDMFPMSSVLVAVRDGRVWFNTSDCFKSVAFDGSDERVEYAVDTAGKCICGAAVIDGQIYYTLGTSEFPQGPEEYIALSEDDRVYFEPTPTDTASSATDAPDSGSSADGESGRLNVAIIAAAASLLLVVIAVAVMAGRRKRR